MKNLSKRSKIIVAVVAVVVVAGLVVIVAGSQMTGVKLFGAAVPTSSLTPNNPTLEAYSTLVLTAPAPSEKCLWNTSNANIADFDRAGVLMNPLQPGSVSGPASMTIKGKKAGTVTITAMCEQTIASTQVTVKYPSLNPDPISLTGAYREVSVPFPGATSCVWSTSNPDVAPVGEIPIQWTTDPAAYASITTGATAIVKAQGNGTATITAVCGFKTAQAQVTVAIGTGGGQDNRG